MQSTTKGELRPHRLSNPQDMLHIKFKWAKIIPAQCRYTQLQPSVIRFKGQFMGRKLCTHRIKSLYLFQQIFRFFPVRCHYASTDFRHLLRPKHLGYKRARQLLGTCRRAQWRTHQQLTPRTCYCHVHQPPKLMVGRQIFVLRQALRQLPAKPSPLRPTSLGYAHEIYRFKFQPLGRMHRQQLHATGITQRLRYFERRRLRKGL